MMKCVCDAQGRLAVRRGEGKQWKSLNRPDNFLDGVLSLRGRLATIRSKVDDNVGLRIVGGFP